jgi:hypothetical protein
MILHYLHLNCNWFLSMWGGGIHNDFIILFVCNSGGAFIHFLGSASSDYILLFLPL